MKNYFAGICFLSSMCESILNAGRAKEYELPFASLSNFAAVRRLYTNYAVQGDAGNIVALYKHVDGSGERRRIITSSSESIPYEMLSVVFDHVGIYQSSETQKKVTLSGLMAKAETDSRLLNEQIDAADHVRFTQDKIFLASVLFSAATYYRNRPFYSMMGLVLSGYAFYTSYQSSFERLLCNTERDALQRLVDDCRALSGTQAKKSTDSLIIVVTFPDTEMYVQEGV